MEEFQVEVIRNTIFLIIFIISLFYMMKERRRVLTGQTIEEPLTKKEKALMWVLCIFNPIIAGAVFYYGWIKKLPVKARQVNRISIIAFFVSLVVFLSIFGTLTYYAHKVDAEYERKFHQARQLIQDKKFDEAQTILLALDKEIHSSGVYYNLALTYEGQYDDDQAVTQLNKLLEVDTNNEQAIKYRTYLQQKIEIENMVGLVDAGRTEEAKARLTKLTDAESQVIKVSAHVFLATIYYSIEQNKSEAIQQLEIALRIDPNNKEAQQFLSQLKKGENVMPYKSQSFFSGCSLGFPCGDGMCGNNICEKGEFDSCTYPSSSSFESIRHTKCCEWDCAEKDPRCTYKANERGYRVCHLE